MALMATGRGTSQDVILGVGHVIPAAAGSQHSGVVVTPLCQQEGCPQILGNGDSQEGGGERVKGGKESPQHAGCQPCLDVGQKGTKGHRGAVGGQHCPQLRCGRVVAEELGQELPLARSESRGAFGGPRGLTQHRSALQGAADPQPLPRAVVVPEESPHAGTRGCPGWPAPSPCDTGGQLGTQLGTRLGKRGWGLGG